MSILIVLNDAPYGNERLYNGLRLALALARQGSVALKVFLMGDAASGARQGQKVPNGYYNIQTMVSGIARAGGTVGVCGTCMDARGIAAADLVEGTARSTMDELATWTAAADKVLVF